MKSGVLAVGYLLANMAFTPAVAGASKDSTKSESTQEYSQGSRCDGNICMYFQAQVFSASNGTLIGHASFSFQNMGTGAYSAVSCSGARYADTISVDKGGKSRIKGTFDPGSPGCFGTNSSTITVDLVGEPGSDRYTSEGTSTSRTGSATYKYKYESSTYPNQIFSGNGGYLTGEFSGYSSKSKHTDKTKIKSS